MAVTIPSIFQEQSRTRPAKQQGVDVSISPEAFGAEIGRGLQNLGRGVNQLAEGLRMRKLVEDEAKARENLSAYMDARREFLDNPESGVLSRLGGAAIGTRDEDTARMRELREQFSTGLTGQAALTFARGADSLDAAAKDLMIRHEGSQLKAYSGQQSAAIVGSALNEASANFRDPGLAEFYLDTAANEVRRQAQLEGWSPEATEVKILQTTSAGLRAIALNMAASDPVGADAFVRQNSDRMTAKDVHDVTAGLEVAVIDAKARSMLDSTLGGVATGSSSRTTTSTSGDVDGVPRWLVAAESSGNPNARPLDENGVPRSSALGSVQFLEGTYRQNVEELRAKGGAKWAEGLTDAEILATRADPEKEAEVYHHFRAKNATILERNGYEVAPRNEYIMHHFGEGRGPLMLALEAGGLADSVVADNFFSAAEMKANPQYRGMTMAAVMDLVDRKANPSGATANPRGAFNAGQGIADPKVQERYMQLLAQRLAMQDRLDAQDRSDALEEAWKLFNDDNVMPEQLPPELALRMGQNGFASHQSAVANVLTGTDVTDEHVVFSLNELYNNDPATFAELDLSQYLPTLSRAVMSDMQQKQAAVQQNAKQPVGAKIDFSEIREGSLRLFQATVGFAPGAATKPDDMAKWNRFEDQMRAGMTRFFETEGRNMTSTETRELASALLIEATINPPGLLNETSGFVFDTPFAVSGSDITLNVDLADLPRAERERLATDFVQEFGRPPSEDELVHTHTQQVLSAAGIPPTVTINDIPPRRIDAVRAKNPNATDAEIIALYTEYLLSRGARR